MIDWLRAAEPEITLGERTLPIELRRMKRAKRLTLRLAPDGSAVRITLPQWCAAREALAFAHARADWLGKQLAKVPEPCDPLSTGRVLYRGADLSIAWTAGAARKPRLDGDVLHVGGGEETVTRRIQRWLEAEALRLFEADAADYCAAAALPCTPVRITRARRRWGSCSSEGVLRLNWRLIQAPDPVRRSVVAHEVAHLVHFDHSPSFHALLGQIYDGDIVAANRWLASHGRTLYAAFG